jgi:protein-tyrosine phosphatase
MSKVYDMWGGGTTGGTKKKTGTIKASCWENHPVYEIDGMPIIGGSCTKAYPDTDVFIALDGGGRKGKRSYPWNKGVDIYFKIVDMQVPDDIKEFKKLLSYTAKQMKAGKRVFVGCIGGHGRTGLFLAALTTFMTGEKDSIKKVRAEYCPKAVESNVQMDWLHQYFDITKAEPSKKVVSNYSKNKGKNSWPDLPDNWGHQKEQGAWIDGKVTDAKPATYMHTGGSKIVLNND